MRSCRRGVFDTPHGPELLKELAVHGGLSPLEGGLLRAMLHFATAMVKLLSLREGLFVQMAPWAHVSKTKLDNQQLSLTH